jgi:ribA/ribD-fused uncharacterized protein
LVSIFSFNALYYIFITVYKFSGVSLMKEVRFYRANDPEVGFFSNLYRRQIAFEEDIYPTAEHAYQAGKARKKEVRDWLMAAPSPALLAMAAHGLYYWDITPGWSTSKFARMKAVLHAKFSQHADLRQGLLRTGQARLVEAATVDNPVNRLWGEVNGIGQNMLGTLLMEVRDEIRVAMSGSKKSRRQKRHTTSVAA